MRACVWVCGGRTRTLRDGEATLASYSHPDPYIIPYSYGGSKYARNPPVPAEVKVVKDFGREDYVL